MYNTLNFREDFVAETMRFSSSGRAFQRIAPLYVIDLCPTELAKDSEWRASLVLYYKSEICDFC